MSNLHQQLMDQAYTRWQSHRDWSQDQFMMRLSWPEKVAVTIGNLNYQVENGGFMQWHDNGYSEYEMTLIDVLNELNTDAANQVAHLVEGFMKDAADVEDEEEWEDAWNVSNDLSDQFYTINKQLLADVEDFLQRELHGVGCNPNE